MPIQVFPVDGSVHEVDEIASSMESNCVLERPPLSLGSHGVLVDVDCSKSLDPPDIPRMDVLAGTLTSITICEPSRRIDGVGEEYVNTADVSHSKFPEVISSSLHRGSRRSKSTQKTMTRKPVREPWRSVGNRSLLDLISVKFERRQRSNLCRRARSSTWGLIGNIWRLFDPHAASNVSHNELRESRTRSASLNVRLKVKLRKDAYQSCVSNRSPVVDRDKYEEVKIESSKSDNDVGKNLMEVPRRSCLDQGTIPEKDSLPNVLLVQKDSDEVLVSKGSNAILDVPSIDGFSRSRDTAETNCLEPGTSPDSEVINATPESQTSRLVSEDLPDILIPSKDYVPYVDTSSFILQQTGEKQGNKINKLSQAGDCTVDRFPNSEIINNAETFSDYGQNGVGERLHSGGVAISTVSTVASCNALSDGPLELLASSQVNEIEVCTDKLNVENERDLSLNIGFQSPESLRSCMLLPCANPKSQKHKKGHASGLRKSGSETESVKKKAESSKQKGGRKMPNSNCNIVEGNGDGLEVYRMQNSLQRGNSGSGDLGELKEGHRSTAEDVSSSAMMPSAVGDQAGTPSTGWVCCDICGKWRRIPSVLVDAINATDCRWICKDNEDSKFADCSIPQEMSNADINAELEISDDDDDGCATQLNSEISRPKLPAVPQQSSWKLIKSNLFLHRSRKNQPIDEIMVCQCKPPLDGRKGCRDGCLNRMLNIECVKGMCPCGDLCSNQQFQNRKYAKLKCFPCGKKGYGLQSEEDIPKGRFLIEYVGEVLDMQAYEARQREYASKGHKHFYFMTLNGSEVIDACAKGNLGRFINHSCEPNCRTEKWMVNGEVCIGLFAIREIHKGEELTFDYNYVRVFGAAAKKCVCRSSKCRGYIGGDPTNSEVVVQGDSDEEYPEPSMFCESVARNLEEKVSGMSPFAATEKQSVNNLQDNTGEIDINVGNFVTSKGKQRVGTFVKDKDRTDSCNDVEYMKSIPDKKDSSGETSSLALKLERSIDIGSSEGLLPSSVLHVNTSRHENSRSVGLTSKTTKYEVAEDDVKPSSCILERAETSSLSSTMSNISLDTADTKRRPNFGTRDTQIVSKFHRKESQKSASVKRRKPKSNDANITNSVNINKSPVLPSKSKKIPEDTFDGRFEAVQKKLNYLLDADGGISKRRDASRGYLKLLYLTAASGDSSSGQGIQSNRDLSMILDALLKTKSRSVLVDIMNKNGLQMLHNIMKRCRKEFIKIPILRKLLKVLEYLAGEEILTLENINKDPPRPGVESFSESILKLTEHDDKQVHQIARSFRDRWVRRKIKKQNCVPRGVERMDLQRVATFDKLSGSHNHTSDTVRKPIEAVGNCVKQSTCIAHKTDSKSVEGFSPSGVSGTNVSNVRKRKSRWDHPEDKIEIFTPPSKKLEAGEAVSETKTKDEDAPPGFSYPLNRPVVQPNTFSMPTGASPCEAVVGQPQGRFVSQMPTSYGVPLPVMQQLGTPPDACEGWVVAPSLPFHPFPPLPQYPRERREHLYSEQNQHYPTTSGSTPIDMTTPSPNNHHRGRGPNILGRKFFKQRKWTNQRFGPSWRNDYGGFSGPRNSNNVMGSIGGSYGNSFHHNMQHQHQHQHQHMWH